MADTKVAGVEPIKALEDIADLSLKDIRDHIEAIPKEHRTEEVLTAIYKAHLMGSLYGYANHKAPISLSQGMDDYYYFVEAVKITDKRYNIELKNLFGEYGFEIDQQQDGKATNITDKHVHEF